MNDKYMMQFFRNKNSDQQGTYLIIFTNRITQIFIFAAYLTTTMKEKASIHIILAFIAIYLIWGSTYLVNKICLVEIDPFILSGSRFTVAGLAVFLIAAIKKIPLGLSKLQFKNTFWIGFLFISIGNGFAINALQYLDSGFMALMISTQPLILLLMMWLLEGKVIGKRAFIGVFLGIIGVFLMVTQDILMVDENAWYGLMILFVSLVTWGYGSLFVAKSDLPKNYFVNSAYQMLLGSLFLYAMSYMAGESIPNLAKLSTKFYYSFSYLVVFGSIIAFTSFNYLLKHVSPDKVSTNTYVNPIVAIFLGWWILDEIVTVTSIIASGILLVGVYFINTNKRGSRKQ